MIVRTPDLRPHYSNVTLSSAELRVVTRSGTGETYVEMAAALGIALDTLKSHMKVASEKLHARNRTQLVVQALRQGVITLADIPEEV